MTLTAYECGAYHESIGLVCDVPERYGEDGGQRALYERGRREYREGSPYAESAAFQAQAKLSLALDNARALPGERLPRAVA